MLDFIQSGIHWTHIVAGGLGLIAFWVPVLTRKGGKTHKKYGRVFKWSAYTVVWSAGIAVLVHLLVARAEGAAIADAADSYGFLFFLAYLALVTGIILRHGLAVLEHKRDITEMGRPLDRGLAWVSIGASLALIAFALYYNPGNKIVLFALSPLGLGTGFGILKAIRGGRPERTPWIHEHLEAMLGAGIAYHTAFVVFGASRLFDIGLTGPMAVVPWVLPAAIGIPATAIWTRKYRKDPKPETAQPAESVA